MSDMLKHVTIVIPVAPNETAQQKLLDDLSAVDAEIILSSEGSRAKSLNIGAEKANQPFIWFVHADTRISQHNIDALETALEKSPDALHYFDLKYDQQGWIRLNTWGANLRSRLFGMPYGDQGLCVSKKNFTAIGGYPENTPYGEDLLFVRLAKRKRLSLNRIASPMLTSARKYSELGWLKLTAYRQIQVWKLMRHKL